MARPLNLFFRHASTPFYMEPRVLKQLSPLPLHNSLNYLILIFVLSMLSNDHAPPPPPESLLAFPSLICSEVPCLFYSFSQFFRIFLASDTSLILLASRPDVDV